MKTLLIALIALLPIVSYADTQPAPTPVVTLNTAFADILTKATTTAGQAKDFVMSQLPDVVQQLLAWKMAESIMWDALSAFFFIYAFTYVTKWFKFGIKHHWGDSWYDGDVHHDEGESIPVIIIGGIIGIITCVISIVSAFTCFNVTWVQIWLAPKVYLIEYARYLLR